MPPKALSNSQTKMESLGADDILSRCTVTTEGMDEQEIEEMKFRVVSLLLVLARVPGAADLPSNWHTLADDIAMGCDLADHRRFQQRKSWVVVVGRCMAIHATYTKRFSFELAPIKGHVGHLYIWMFYVA